jgi:GNAT superfamily N-acetyltransferase
MSYKIFNFLEHDYRTQALDLFKESLGLPVFVKNPYQGILKDNELVGVYFLEDSCEGLFEYEIIICIKQEYRRQGLASLLLQKLPDNCYAYCVNESSYKLFLKNGFKLVKIKKDLMGKESYLVKN